MGRSPRSATVETSMKPLSSSLDPDLLRTVLETVVTPVILLDQETRIRLFNAAAEEVSGYPRSEVLGREVWFLLDPAEEERAAAVLRRLVADETERLDAEEVAWVTRKGERRSLTWSASTLRRDDGTVRLLVCTAVDPTEMHALHRQARTMATEQAARAAREDALRASESRFSGTVERASEAARRDKVLASSLELEATLSAIADLMQRLIHDLLEVLSNLVGNAVKHTPEGGRVAVRAETGPDELRVSVSDTGPGIPAGTGRSRARRSSPTSSG